MEIAPVGPDDWRRFRAVRLASLLESPSAFGSRHEDWLNAPEERWRRRLTQVPVTLIASDDVADVGVVSGQLDAERWVELISLWVAPSARGTGVAAGLISAVVVWATRQERSTFLMVRSDNVRARTAYERFGFLDTGVPAGWPTAQAPEQRMELRPGGAHEPR